MKNELQTIKVMPEYLQGPILLSEPETGKPITGIGIIYTDSIIKELNTWLLRAV